MTQDVDIKVSQKEFYEKLATDYDAEVDADIIESEKKYRKLFDEGARYQHGLDIGCGTGNWTRGLIEVCDKVTAVDSSARMLDICKQKHGEAKVVYQCVDVFDLPELGNFDIVFSTFWVSHVPEECQSEFWIWVADMLKPGGSVIMLDSIGQGPGGGGSERVLSDGSQYNIVKRNYDFENLVKEVRDYGIALETKLYGASIYTLTGVRI